MSKIHGMMDVGKRSMMNSQTALQTVGHNIANKSTEGYSRQRVEIQSAEPTGVGKLRIGNGAKTAAVNRVNNSYLEKQIGKEQSNLGYNQGKMDSLTRVEQVFNEQTNKGLNVFVTDFYNAFREFGNNPESLATRTQVKETAEFLTRDFKRVNDQLVEIQRDADQQIATYIHEVNEMAAEIAKLNEKVQLVESSGAPANDERDRRDLLVKKLGEKINIRWAEGQDGMVTITAGNSALLVTGHDAKTLEVRATPETDTKGEGNVDIFYKNNPRAEATKVTDQMTGGAIGGLLEVRDKVIGSIRQETDVMAYSLASTVNALHSRGYDAAGRPGGDFFKLPAQVRHAASQIQVEERIANDPTKIASALQPGSPGDNRVANAIGQLQFEKVVGAGSSRGPAGVTVFQADDSSTVDEFYNSIVGKVGIQTRRAEVARDAQKDVVAQLGNIRESISGVSLDEETTKLIEFQKSFDASARLIRTADEMFDTVLNLKRM